MLPEASITNATLHLAGLDGRAARVSMMVKVVVDVEEAAMTAVGRLPDEDDVQVTGADE